MSKITITRSSEWISLLKKNNIYIDGAKVGVMSVGETKNFEIAPGKHTLTTKSRFAGGNSRLIVVEVGKDENKTINLRPAKYIQLIYAFSLIMAAIISLLIIRFFNLDIRTGPELMLGFLVLYLLYYFTFGINRYWKLEEVRSMKTEGIA